MKMNKDIVPEDFNLGLVLVDLLPVLLFGGSAILFGILTSSFMIKIGAIICFLSGFLKVLWKLIVVIKKRNVWFLFIQMRIFMPIGFLILLVGIIVASIKGNMGQVLSACGGFPQIILFILGFVGMGMMGYFAKHLDSADVKANWIEQITNTIAQLCILIALILTMTGCAKQVVTEAASEMTDAVIVQNCEDNDDLTKETTVWKSLYIDVINGWTKDFVRGYEFIYLDDDDIPELVLYCDDEAWIGFDIYTIVNGEAAHLDRFDMDGERETTYEYPLTSHGRQGQGDCFFAKTGIYIQSLGMMGCYQNSGYTLRDGALHEIFQFEYNNTTEWNEDADPISYGMSYIKKDGSFVTVTKEEDVQFEDCPELKELEKEYGFSFSDVSGLPYLDSLLCYNDIMDFLHSDFDSVQDWTEE